MRHQKPASILACSASLAWVFSPVRAGERAVFFDGRADERAAFVHLPGWKPLLEVAQACDEPFAGPSMEAVKEAWIRDLGELASTREQAAFIGSDASRFVPADFKEKNFGDSLAVYEDGRIFINERFLARWARELKSQGVEDSSLNEALAAATVHAVAHEVRHAITDREVEALAGMRLSEPLLEDEVVCSFEQVLARREALARWPELARLKLSVLDKVDSVLEEGAASGLVGMRMFVESSYAVNGVRSVLKTPREILLKHYREDLDKFEALLSRGPAAGGPSPRALRGLVKRVRATIEFFSDEGRYEKVKEFYKSRFQELEGRSK
jgi:hypothetical protein